MSNLREKIVQRIEDRFYMFCKDKTIARHAACDVLDLPELKSIIEKAEKYDKLFSKLQVVEECKECNNGTIGEELIYEPDSIGHPVACPDCNGTGKIRRPARLEDVDIADILDLISKAEGYPATNYVPDLIRKLTTPSGGRLVVKKEDGITLRMTGAFGRPLE